MRLIVINIEKSSNIEYQLDDWSMFPPNSINNNKNSDPNYIL